MRNPLRSEAEAYRLLWIVIAGAAVIIVAAFINTWLGVAAAVIAFGALGWWLMQAPVPGAPPRRGRRGRAARRPRAPPRGPGRRAGRAPAGRFHRQRVFGVKLRF